MLYFCLLLFSFEFLCFCSPMFLYVFLVFCMCYVFAAKESLYIYIHKQKKSPSQTLRDIYFSRRLVGWISCIYVCFLFSFEFVYDLFILCFFMFFIFLFDLCFRLVLLSVCIYNQKHI